MIRIEISIWTLGKWQQGEIHLLCEDYTIFSQSLYSMLDSNYQAPIILNVIAVHNARTAVIQVRPLIQDFNNQAWGIRDFSISYYPCPAGCVICSKIDSQSTCSQWIQSSSQFTALDVSQMTHEGWFINDDKEYFSFNQCNGVSFFGFYKAGRTLKRTFYLEPHNRMRIQFLLAKLNDWGNSVLFLMVDKVIQMQVKDKTDIYHNINYCDSNSGLDSITRIYLDISHSSQLLGVELYTTLSETQLDNSFGIRDFTIFLMQSNTSSTDIQFNPNKITFFSQLTFVDAEGWIIQGLVQVTDQYDCAGTIIFGRFTKEHITRTLKLTPHRFLSLSITFYCLDSWDNEILYIKIDGTEVARQSYGPWDGNHLRGNSDYPDKIFYFSYSTDHSDDTISFDFYTNLDEDAGNESFGMRNFRLRLADCPMDCWDCNNISGDYCQYIFWDEYWNLYDSNLAGEGWGFMSYQNTAPQITLCNGQSILGGYGSISNQSYLKLIQVLDFHIRIRLILKLYVIGDWNNDQILVEINDSLIYSKKITTTNSNFNCQSGLEAFIIDIDQVIEHSYPEIIIYITNTIPFLPKNNCNTTSLSQNHLEFEMLQSITNLEQIIIQFNISS